MLLWSITAALNIVFSYQASISQRGTEPINPLGHPQIHETNYDFASRYLRRFGYTSTDANNLTLPLVAFQSWANIKKTGWPDKSTINMMKRKRCGNKDVESRQSRRVTVKREIQGSKWRKRHLTYRVEKYTRDMSRATVDNVIEKAFQTWSDVTPLTFTASVCNPVDIAITFTSGNHGDGSPFDGQGGILAHAFFPGTNRHPMNGDAHFDDDETWVATSYPNYGTSLLGVMVHEIGHSLGLRHSRHQGAVMWSWYSGKSVLHNDDITNIQYLYGPPGSMYDSVFSQPPLRRCIPPGRRVISSTTVPVTPAPTVKPFTSLPTVPQGRLCSGKVDAVLVALSRSMYIFIDDMVYTKLRETSGRPVNQIFPRGPSTVDAAFSVNGNRLFLIKGNLLWRYTIIPYSKITLDLRYPRTVGQELGIYVNRVDSVYSVNGSSVLCLFSGDRYWYLRADDRLNITPVADYPIRNHPVFSKIWPINAALRWANGKRYFFVGSKYYSYDLSYGLPRLTGPRDTAFWWFRCPL